MNKILLAFILFISLTACDESATIEKYYSQPPFGCIEHFEYQGHKYIYITGGSGHGVYGGAVHDPDCGCNKEK